jgi:hypothetical protein
MIKVSDTHIVLGKADDEDGMPLAEQAFMLLCVAYPSYNWSVVERDGLLVIKELTLSSIYGPYGMAFPTHKIVSASEFKRELLHYAGELLERAGLPRGLWTGQMPNLEGTEKRFYRPWRS